jgi:hypothetical protein
MTQWRRTGILSVVLWGALCMAPGKLVAASDGFTLQDMKLQTAGALLDVCTIEPGHEHYDVARAFCYGFFEGGIRYDQAIAGADYHKDLVCEPEGTTRLQAVDVFVTYMKANPQYTDEGPIDAIFRALMAKWPCTT